MICDFFPLLTVEIRGWRTYSNLTFTELDGVLILWAGQVLQRLSLNTAGHRLRIGLRCGVTEGNTCVQAPNPGLAAATLLLACHGQAAALMPR